MSQHTELDLGILKIITNTMGGLFLHIKLVYLHCHRDTYNIHKGFLYGI